MNRNLINKLITHYKSSILKIKKKEMSLYDAKDWCLIRNINFGLCHCITHFFDEKYPDFPDSDLTYISELNECHYLYATPYETKTIEELIQSLEFRVNYLRKLLKKTS